MSYIKAILVVLAIVAVTVGAVELVIRFGPLLPPPPGAARR